MKKSIRFIDIFAGIGGFRKGFESSNFANYSCVLSCELDKAARKTYSLLYNVAEIIDKKTIMSEVEQIKTDNCCFSSSEIFYDDAIELSNLSEDDLKALISLSEGVQSKLDNPYELLCAGFPCQPFSRSGKRRAFNDENKGNLFFALKKIIEKTTPQYVILENVKGLITVGDNQLIDDINDFGKGLRTEEINKGRTFFEILDTLVRAKYRVVYALQI